MEKNDRKPEGMHAAEPATASHGHNRFTTIAKVVSRERKACATAKEVYFRPPTSAVACMHDAVRNRALIAFSRIILQPGYIPATKTSGRHRLLLRSTTRPSTENTREVAPSELMICGWVEVIASLAHRSYPGVVKTAMISRLLYTKRILVSLEVSLALEQTVRAVYIIPPLRARAWLPEVQLSFCKCARCCISRGWVATSRVASIQDWFHNHNTHVLYLCTSTKYKVEIISGRWSAAVHAEWFQVLVSLVPRPLSERGLGTRLSASMNKTAQV